ncbi:MAG: hypothetical protein AB7O45_06495 [Alphaproteobacteria bacterium]
MTKYVLCRPEGGLNDMLCQIERCCRYAERTGRTVVVEANFRPGRFFRDRLDRYFGSLQPRLLLDPTPVMTELVRASVYPEHLRGRLNDYVHRWDRTTSRYVERAQGQPLTFDFMTDYRHEVLVHHQPGGGRNSLFAFLRLALTPALVAELARRWAAIGPGYAAVHVRHTDYRTDYAAILTALRRAPPARLLVATDNSAVLEEFRQALGPERVHNFAWLGVGPGVPLHRYRVGVDVVERRNSDAILDLLMLGLARELHIVKVENRKDGGFSGFSQLAADLFRAKAVLRHLVAPAGISAGLG